MENTMHKLPQIKKNGNSQPLSENKSLQYIINKKYTDYTSEKEFQTTKAKAYLSRTKFIDEPNIIFTIEDRIRQQVGKKFDIDAKSPKKIISNSLHLNHQINKSIQGQLKNSKTKKLYRVCQDRRQMFGLAKWMDQKLSHFKSASQITITDIIQYKQTILNYGLGKIIDSVSKKCKQQGQLLLQIWNNTFNIFQALASTLSQITFDNDKQNLKEQQELNNIYKENLNYLILSNEQIKSQNNSILEKMKSVIIWNRKLRRQRKKQDIQNRILKYRLQTYTQGLEDTIQMLLRSSNDVNNIAYAKKIISKLTIEKRRKKKDFKFKQQYQQYKQSARQVVTNWLRRNTIQCQSTIFQRQTLKEKDIMFLENFTDQDQMKNTKISDFFKLIDIGIQVKSQTINTSMQCNPTEMKDVAAFTIPIYKHDKGIQIQMQKNIQQTENQLKAIDEARSASISVKRRNQKLKSSFNTINKLDNKKQQQSRKIKKRQTFFRQIDQQDEENYESNNLISDIYVRLTSEIDNYAEFIRQANIESEKPNNSYGCIEGNASNKYFLSLKNNNQDQENCNIQLNYLTNLERKYSLQVEGKEYKNGRTFTRKGSLNFIDRAEDETEENDFRELIHKKKFNQIYKQQKQSMNKDKYKFYRRLVRNRSFHKDTQYVYSNQQKVQQRSLHKNYFYNNPMFFRIEPRKTNAYQTNIDAKIDKLTKKLFSGNTVGKSKTFNINNQLVNGVINAILANKPNPPPKNKQFFNSSLAIIIKHITHLFEDYIRQIKRQRDQIQFDISEKVFYPLRILLTEGMNCKYGLKDIAEKKLKDFLQKIYTFSTVSERVSLYSILLGMQNQNVCADELLIYLRCLVYFQNKLTILNTKDMYTKTNVSIEMIEQNFLKITEGVLCPIFALYLKQNVIENMKQQERYLSIQNISKYMILEVLKAKNKQKGKYLPFYQICLQGNFFVNLYLILKVMKEQKLQFYYSVDHCMKQFIKKSDLMDQIYGKVVSQQRFILCCMTLRLPSFHKFEQILLSANQKLISTLAQKGQIFSKYTPDNAKKVTKISEKWGCFMQYDRLENSQRWMWYTFRILFLKTESAITQSIGILDDLSNAIAENIDFLKK